MSTATELKHGKDVLVLEDTFCRERAYYASWLGHCYAPLRGEAGFVQELQAKRVTLSYPDSRRERSLGQCSYHL